jgi:hypothetical protein
MPQMTSDNASRKVRPHNVQADQKVHWGWIQRRVSDIIINYRFMTCQEKAF